MERKGTLQRLLNTAEEQLWTDFNNGSEFMQRPNIGTAREVSLGEFLRSHLPGRYSISVGEVVDYSGRQTGQIDLMIYDGSSTCPLMNLPNERGVLLPAEALLATIEVKTTLSGTEMVNAIRGVKNVHDLKPWGKPWSVARKDGAHADDQLPRVFTSIFAYKTDYSEDNWAQKEVGRLRAKAEARGVSLERIDRLAVLSRGLVLPASHRVAQPGQKGVLGLWFFSLINFLDREVSRRKEFPWAKYETRSERIWHKIVAE